MTQIKLMYKTWMLAALLILAMVAALIFIVKPGTKVKNVSVAAVGASSSDEIRKFNTKNGATVLFVERKDLPMVDIQVTFAAGSARDGDVKGIAALTNQLLSTSTKNLTIDELTQGFESIGAEFSVSSGRDMAVISLRTLSESKYLNKAINLLQEVINAPAFNEEDIERERQRLLVYIKQLGQEASSVAEKAYFELLYGNDPYANPVWGEADSIIKITKQQIEDFYNKYYVANNATIAIVGDISTDKAQKIASNLVESLNPGEKAFELPLAVAKADAVLEVVEFPSSQTHILMGNIGIKYSDPDYFSLYVGNHILGGSSLSSRVFTIIREQQGLAYDAQSYFLPMQSAGPFVMKAQTRNAKAQHTVEEMKKILSDFVENGPTETELQAAKDYIIGSFALKLDGNAKLLYFLSLMGFYELPLNFIDTYVSNVEKVDISGIKNAFANKLKVNSLQTIMVGKKP